eukprot:4182239-Pyramimonas_sp.AAC.1
METANKPQRSEPAVTDPAVTELHATTKSVASCTHQGQTTFNKGKFAQIWHSRSPTSDMSWQTLQARPRPYVDEKRTQPHLYDSLLAIHLQDLSTSFGAIPKSDVHDLCELGVLQNTPNSSTMYRRQARFTSPSSPEGNIRTRNSNHAAFGQQHNEQNVGAG